MEHYRNPRNYGCLDNRSFKCLESNASCGDEIAIDVKLDNNRIADIRFSGNGCAISRASASMLSEFVKGKPVAEVKALRREDIIKMLGIPIGPVRTKCAMLCLVALKKGISDFEAKNAE